MLRRSGVGVVGGCRWFRRHSRSRQCRRCRKRRMEMQNMMD